MNLIKKECEVSLPISLKNLELDIGVKKITIKDRFTLILGKFKRESFQEYKNQFFLQVLENIDLIPVKVLINYFRNQPSEIKNTENSLKLLEYLTNYRKIVEYNLDVFKKFSKVIEIVFLTFRLDRLSERKDQLDVELELAKRHKKSSDLSAIVNLINKLKVSIKINQKKLNYIKEDYFQRKNQIDQIKKNLANFDDNIRELNQIKKTCFSQINRITRQIEGSANDQENGSMLKLGIEGNLSNAEKIRALQKKAKETQYEINQIKTRSNLISEDLEKFTPQYNIYKKDYEEILDSIKEDENRIRTMQIEYDKEISINGEDNIEGIKDLLKTPVRTSLEIEKEISKINSELDSISTSNKFFIDDNRGNLRVIIEKLRELDDIMRSNDEKIRIRKNDEEISNIFEEFNTLESEIKDLKEILNCFIKEIGLEVKFLLVINDTNTSLYLKTEFIRNNKEKTNFEDLTTPEKIFFIVSLFITNGVILGKENIIFSNLFIPNAYNKGGSIYRTIRRIIPLFETNNNLSKFKLIFLMSNLELKKEINNLRLIHV